MVLLRSEAFVADFLRSFEKCYGDFCAVES